MTLQELYKQKGLEPTPKQLFITELMKATNTSFDTVLSWCLGRRKPSKGKRAMIARTLGVDVEELFPK